MAENTALKKLRNSRGRTKSSSSSSSATGSIYNTVNNYKTRLQAAGYNLDDINDDRNIVEKALNLEKDQNALFDIFEILNRPQNALLSGISELQNGGSFLTGLKEGITGEQKQLVKTF